MTAPDRTVAVVAAYRPDAALPDRVRATAEQVEGVVVVDDGSTDAATDGVLAEAERAGATVVRRGRNAGIAAALNVGVAEARRLGATHVLTLDQDSRPGAGYVAAALDTLRRAEAAGLAVGFVAAASYGPHPAPTRRGPAGFVRAFDPMQSGLVIPVATLDRVGGFDEGLVIDGVDSEFTARVGAAGLLALVGEGCRLEHALGRREPTTLFGRPVRIAGRELSYNYHAPTRVYYIARNGTALTRRYAASDPAWVARRLVEETKAHGMRVVLGRDRVRTLRAMAAGFADGLRGRTGPIPERTERALRGDA